MSRASFGAGVMGVVLLTVFSGCGQSDTPSARAKPAGAPRPPANQVRCVETYNSWLPEAAANPATTSAWLVVLTHGPLDNAHPSPDAAVQSPAQPLSYDTDTKDCALFVSIADEVMRATYNIGDRSESGVTPMRLPEWRAAVPRANAQLAADGTLALRAVSTDAG